MAILSAYTVGTAMVTANSKIVTGQGTSWTTAGIREGDRLWLRGLTVSVASVDSNAQITLAQPWPGSTSSAGEAYELQYTPDASRVLASSRDVLNAVNSSGLTGLKDIGSPGADTMAYYTGIASAALTSLTPYARSLLGSMDMDAAQAVLGLIAQSSQTDATLGNMLKVGGFGLGSTAAPILANIDAFDIPSGIYRLDKTVTTGTKPPLADTADAVLVLHPTASQTIQVFLGMTELGRNYIRKSNSDATWAPWRSIMMDFEFGTGAGSALDADMVDGYHASDFLLVSDYNAGGMLALLSDVDGAGSGLDADLLDGMHAGSFCQTSSNQTVGGIKTWSSVIRANANQAEQISVGYNRTQLPLIGFYRGTTRYSTIQDDYQNGLTFTSGIGAVLALGAAGVATLDGNQIALDSDVTALETRMDDAEYAILEQGLNTSSSLALKLDASAYTAADVLTKIKTVDGAASGLDADLLDGQHASYFAVAATVASTYLPLAGGTMTGALTVPGVTSTGAINIQSTSDPSLHFYDTDGTVDARRWRLFAGNNGSTFHLAPVTDAGAYTSGNWLSLHRNANLLSDVRLSLGENQTSLLDVNSLVSRQRGDTRYLQKTAGLNAALTGQLWISSGQPTIGFQETDQAAGTQVTRFAVANGDLYFGYGDGADDGTSIVNTFIFERLGGASSGLAVLNRAAADGRYLQLSGGTLTGGLTVTSGWIKNTSGSLIVANTQPALLLQETDQTSGAQTWRVDSAGGSFRIMTASDDGTANHVVINSFSRNGTLANATDTPTRASGDGRWLQLAGGTMTGLLVLSADPSAALGAATKQYADARETAAKAYADGLVTNRRTDAQNDARYLQLAGGTLTGGLTIANTYPVINFKDTDAATGSQFTQITHSNGVLSISSADDDGSNAVGLFRFERDGSLSSGNSVVRRLGGDGRYLQLTGGSLSNTLTITTGGADITGNTLQKGAQILYGTASLTNPQIQFKDSAAKTLAMLWSSATSDETRLRSYATNGTDFSELVFYGSTGNLLNPGTISLNGGYLNVNAASSTQNAHLYLRKSNGDAMTLLYGQYNGDISYLRSYANTGGTYYQWGFNGASAVLSCPGNVQAADNSYLLGYDTNSYFTRSTYGSTRINQGGYSLLVGGADQANLTGGFFAGTNTSGTAVIRILTSGNILNTNNSYGAISDAMLKENVVDASPQLEELRQIQIRKYNLIDDAAQMTQIGVVAQELELVKPGLVETDAESGLKSVKYSVFTPILVKAVQELADERDAMKARIEQLEAQMAQVLAALA